MKFRRLFSLLICFFSINVIAQQQYELNDGWHCINVKKIKDNGETISTPDFKLKGFIKATVPGTVLTTMLNNKMIPDPFYGMNNKKIPDIYNTGRDYYCLLYTSPSPRDTR